MYSKSIILLLLTILVNIHYSSVCFAKSIDIKTSVGTVRGQTVAVLNTTVNQFLGIPFAEPPVGSLRFAKPVPKIPQTDIINATIAKHSCYQNDDLLGALVKDVSEDCLVLNIWAPTTNESTKAQGLKPVMFWIYGGAYKDGSIFLPTYDGRVLTTHDIVLVSTNYRIGPFGFLYGGDSTTPGNLGLYDQLMALKWTKENIHLFGGDPDQITIFGESAGSWSVSGHIMSPQSRGLFKRAILESGAIYMDKDSGILSKDKALAEAKQMAKVFNCSTGDNGQQWLDCLRAIDAKKLNNYTLLDTYPIYDTDFLPLNAQESFKTHNYSQDIDIMAGVVGNEGSVLAHNFFPITDTIKTRQDFVDIIKTLPLPGMTPDKIADFYLADPPAKTPKHAFWEFFGDIVIVCPTYLFAKQFAENTPKSQVYFYRWTYPSKFVGPVMGCTDEMGVCHAAEIEHVFGLPVLMGSEDKEFSETVMKMWTNFAKTGQPMAGTGIKWPRLVESGAGGGGGQQVLTRIKEINPKTPDNILINLFDKTCDGFWSNYFN